MLPLLSLRADRTHALCALAASLVLVLPSSRSHASGLPAGVIHGFSNFGGSRAVRTMPNTMTAAPLQATINPADPNALLSTTLGSSSTATAPLTMVSGSKATLTIGVSSIRPGGGYVQVGCDTPAVLVSPSSTWPYDLAFPDGGSYSQQMTITAGTVTQSTTVTVYACEEDVDPTDPANWRVTTTITVLPPSAYARLAPSAPRPPADSNSLHASDATRAPAREFRGAEMAARAPVPSLCSGCAGLSTARSSRESWAGPGRTLRLRPASTADIRRLA
jgi:hypothetical protein